MSRRNILIIFLILCFILILWYLLTRPDVVKNNSGDISYILKFNKSTKSLLEEIRLGNNEEYTLDNDFRYFAVGPKIDIQEVCGGELKTTHNLRIKLLLQSQLSTLNNSDFYSESDRVLMENCTGFKYRYEDEVLNPNYFLPTNGYLELKQIFDKRHGDFSFDRYDTIVLVSDTIINSSLLATSRASHNDETLYNPDSEIEYIYTIKENFADMYLMIHENAHFLGLEDDIPGHENQGDILSHRTNDMCIKHTRLKSLLYFRFYSESFVIPDALNFIFPREADLTEAEIECDLPLNLNTLENIFLANHYRSYNPEDTNLDSEALFRIWYNDISSSKTTPVYKKYILDLFRREFKIYFNQTNDKSKTQAKAYVDKRYKNHLRLRKTNYKDFISKLLIKKFDQDAGSYHLVFNSLNSDEKIDNVTRILSKMESNADVKPIIIDSINILLPEVKFFLLDSI